MSPTSADRSPGANRAATIGATDEEFIPLDIVESYTEAGWWGTETMSDIVRGLAERNPDGRSFVTTDAAATWADYDQLTDEIAATLVALEVEPGARVAIYLPDTVHVHAAMLAMTRAGTVGVGIGARAGDAELTHLIRRTDARVLITMGTHRDRSAAQIVAVVRDRGVEVDRHIVLSGDTASPGGSIQAVYDTSGGGRVELFQGPPAIELPADRQLGPNDLYLLNSTSGTTGLPKCVTQFENRWMHFSKLAFEAGELDSSDVFLGAVPAPFGFGLWTAHFAPTMLGAPCVVLPRFSADEMIRLIERERVTVLCCVSTQFKMLLNSPLCDTADLSSLRVMFTGGEAVPYNRAREFEERVGAKALQFYGSNESGAFTYTTLKDTGPTRLQTAGRLIPNMGVKLYDEDGNDITATGGPGQAGGTGPLTCRGYYTRPDDEVNPNDGLYAPDGALLMGDLVTIDQDSILQVVGRTSEFIIRGGKNISSAAVEEEVETHPQVDLVAVVPVPDELFGERVCAIVVLKPGSVLTLDDITAHLTERGVTRETFPERMIIVDSLPTSSGGKVAKGEVKAMLARGELSIEQPQQTESAR